MTIEQKIKMALSFTGISQAELARRLNTTPSNLNQKIRRNTLTKEEMEQIAQGFGTPLSLWAWLNPAKGGFRNFRSP